MERLINMLVDYDKQGRSMVQQAQELRRDTLANLDESKSALAAQFEERAEHRLRYYREQAEAERSEQITSMQQEHTDQCARLRARFEENREAWLQTLCQRSIGG